MTGDKPKSPAERQWAPDEQALLPGLRPALGFPPRDWRPWQDARGNKIDGPKYGGPTFGGKTIVPLVGPDGQPIHLGTFQIIRDARGSYVVIDRSKPMFEEATPPSSDEGTDRKDAVVHSSVIMGREVGKWKDLRRAQAAMIVMHRDAEALKQNLPLDPAQCFDDRKKEIRQGDVALCQYARGPLKGKFAIVDHSQRPRRIFDILPKTLKEAFKIWKKESARRVAAKPMPAVRGVPIAFDVPSGFGWGTGGGSRPSWSERTYPEVGSPSWKTCVSLYAQTGKWCRTANMIWGDQRPSEIEFEALEARKEYLLKAASSETSHRDAPKALRAMKKLSKSDKKLLNVLLEHFDGALIEVKLP